MPCGDKLKCTDKQERKAQKSVEATAKSRSAGKAAAAGKTHGHWAPLAPLADSREIPVPGV